MTVRRKATNKIAKIVIHQFALYPRVIGSLAEAEPGSKGAHPDIHCKASAEPVTNQPKIADPKSDPQV